MLIERASLKAMMIFSSRLYIGTVTHIILPKIVVIQAMRLKNSLTWYKKRPVEDSRRIFMLTTMESGLVIAGGEEWFREGV